MLPRATNGIIFRILVFYLGALFVIMSLVPWNQLSPSVSPFVFVFEKIGMPGAAAIITLVVITAAASSCNSGLFSTGRMLWTLAQRGQGPRAFARLNPQHVPAAGIHASAAVMLIGVVLNYVVPKKVFTWVTSVALIGTLWTWGIILVAHRNYRLAVAAGRVAAAPFRMPLVTVRQLGRAGLSGAGHRAAVARPQHTRRAVRRAVVVRAPRRRLPAACAGAR